jgi:hypothetical protein
MTLSAGDKLGPDEIRTPIGAVGMGERRQENAVANARTIRRVQKGMNRRGITRH